ncbi:MAG: hypothetical protein ACYDGS_07835 [Thermoleophilia bacterium]
MKRTTIILLLIAAILAVAVLATGCGDQSEQADRLIDEVNGIATTIEPKVKQADSLMTQATEQLSQGKLTDEKANLTKAQSLADEIIADLKTAKAKTDEAAALKISDDSRKYLEANGRALQANINMWSAVRDMATTMLADPAWELPETRTKMAELEKVRAEQAAIWQEAWNEAQSLGTKQAGENNK